MNNNQLKNKFLKLSVIFTAVISSSSFSHQEPFQFLDSCDSYFTENYPNRFIIDEVRGTVIDRVTELMWDRCFYGLTGEGCEFTLADPEVLADTEKTYAELIGANAAQHDAHVIEANNDSYRGYSDWRMPNIKELSAMTDSGCTAYTMDSVTNFEFFAQSQRVFPLIYTRELVFLPPPAMISSTPVDTLYPNERLSSSYGARNAGVWGQTGAVRASSADGLFSLRLVRKVTRAEFAPELTKNSMD